MGRLIQRKGRYGFQTTYKEFIKGAQQLPNDVSKTALRHFKKSFRDEGFTDKTLIKWEEVNRRKPGHPQFNPKQQQKILVGKGSSGLKTTLRTKQKSFKKVTIGSYGKPYAAFHNDGIGQKKRQFIGESQVLDKSIERLIRKNIDRAFKKGRLR